MRLVASTPNSRSAPEAIRGALASVSREHLRELVERLSVPRPTGSSENEAIRRAIVSWFSGMPAGELGVEVGGAGNVVVGDPRRARGLVGGHYDSIPGTPGADDNASGVAALLAAASALGPLEGVCYIAFDGEETGLVGSRALVGGLGRHHPEQVHV